MAKYRVTLCRTECADIDVEAGNTAEAKLIAIGKLARAACIADLDLDWNVESDITAGKASKVGD